MSPPDPIAQIPVEVFWSSSADGLVLVDARGVIWATNDSFDKQFGYAPGAIVGEPVEVLVPATLREVHQRHRDRYEDHPVNRPMGAFQSLEAVRADGSSFPANISLARISTDRGPMTIAAVRDLTDRVQIEQRLARANRDQALAEDHDRIANELHDTVIQRLFVLGLGLQGLPGRIEVKEVAEKVSSAVDTIDDIIREIRSTIYGLRHTPDPDEGVRERVARVVHEMEPGLGFAPDLRFVGQVETVGDPAVLAHLGPVVREALSNVTRHARATQVAVTLALADDRLTVEVVDDGCGVDDRVVRSGLANLAERAISLEGSFQVERVPGGGTALIWSVPIRAR